MNAIKIEVVNINGRLVGRTFSDRWNLAQLGYTHLDWSRNQTAMKKFRREFGHEFTITTVKGSLAGITSIERDAFGPVRNINLKVA